MAAPVVVVAAGGLPVTNLGAAGALPLTVVSDNGVAITVVAAGGLPVSLLNESGGFYSAGPAPTGGLNFSIAGNSQYSGQVV